MGTKHPLILPSFILICPTFTLKEGLDKCLASSQRAYEVSQQSKRQITSRQTELAKEKELNVKLSGKVSVLEECVIHQENEDCIKVIKKVFKDHLNLNAEDICIICCHRLGSKRWEFTKRPQPLRVKFHRFDDKQSVWKARKNLKGTNIVVNEDFPKEIQVRRRILRLILQKAIAILGTSNRIPTRGQ